jgi:hypothetical protein
VDAEEKAGLRVIGFVFAWAALFFMLANFFELFSKEGIVWWVFWVLCAICVLVSSICLGPCPGLKQK